MQQRRQPSPTDQSSVPVGARLTALEQGLTAFAKVNATNATVINQGFVALQHGLGLQDAHISVLYRVLNDIRKGEVLVDESGDIAAQFYHQIYAATRGVADGMFALMSAPEPTEAEPVSEPIGDLVPLPDFGGDHAST